MIEGPSGDKCCVRSCTSVAVGGQHSAVGGMIQQSLIPQEISRVDPKLASADSHGVGMSKSGQRYLLKTALPWHPLLPATEWICHGLAHCMHLPVPAWEHCVMPDGRDAIGSRIEGYVLEREYYPSSRPSTDNPHVVSGTYVLDLFVANSDRYYRQWLVTEAGGGKLLRPIDFSRAWFNCWPLPTPAFGSGRVMIPPDRDNSGPFYAEACAANVVTSPEAVEAWEALQAMPKAAWRSIVESLPTGWVERQLSIDLINWWYSPQWRSRIKWIRTVL